MSLDAVEIVSTAHWERDARLERHARYLRRAGLEVRITSHASRGRVAAMARAISSILRTDAGVVILPDPELFAFGGLAARLSGKTAVIDIHEDYSKAAAGREWVPEMLRGVVGFLATVSVALGRVVATRVVVAAPELARAGDVIVRNIPEPGSLPEPGANHADQVVYVGDVTIARGATEMAGLLTRLPRGLRLTLIGNVTSEARDAMTDIISAAGASDRLVLAGRLDHDTAWRQASGSVAGLCLLRPLPAYREAVATKIWEYMAAGIPPVVSDLDGQRRLVARIHPDLVCETTTEAAAVITRLSRDEGFHRRLATIGMELYLQAWEEFRPDLALQSAVAP